MQRVPQVVEALVLLHVVYSILDPRAKFRVHATPAHTDIRSQNVGILQDLQKRLAAQHLNLATRS
jgi:hypothetical protein